MVKWITEHCPAPEPLSEDDCEYCHRYADLLLEENDYDDPSYDELCDDPSYDELCEDYRDHLAYISEVYDQYTFDLDFDDPRDDPFYEARRDDYLDHLLYIEVHDRDPDWVLEDPL